jgi:hypothetical protein
MPRDLLPGRGKISAARLEGKPILQAAVPLLRSPEKWTSQDLQTLKVNRHTNLLAEDIVGAAYLPRDGDQGVLSVFPLFNSRKALAH